jgi:hypothetical protein
MEISKEWRLFGHNQEDLVKSYLPGEKGIGAGLPACVQRRYQGRLTISRFIIHRMVLSAIIPTE